RMTMTAFRHYWARCKCSNAARWSLDARNGMRSPIRGRHGIRAATASEDSSRNAGRKANMMKWKEQLNGDCPRRDGRTPGRRTAFADYLGRLSRCRFKNALSNHSREEGS